MKKSTGILRFSLFCFCLLVVLPVWPQGTDLGTVRGTVTDPTGAVVPKATVEVTDLATNIVRTLISDGEGNYEAAGLRYGAYKVTVSMPGFAKVEITGITLRAGEVVRADAHLTPAAASQSVIITAEAPQIETQSPTIGSTLTNVELTELPRDSRDIYSFLYLNANIAQGAGDGSFKYLGAQTYGAYLTGVTDFTKFASILVAHGINAGRASYYVTTEQTFQRCLDVQNQ